MKYYCADEKNEPEDELKTLISGSFFLCDFSSVEAQ